MPAAARAMACAVQAKAAKKEDQDSEADGEAEEEVQEEEEEAAEHAETTTEQPKVNNKPVVSRSPEPFPPLMHARSCVQASPTWDANESHH